MENLQKEINQYKKTASRAVKIALISCAITIIFAFLSLWILLNQITATANLTKNIRNLEQKILEISNSKME
ncbi:hypothetical protein LS72_008400 [Helicobacter apodemus]|uniref:Uncharacterized protein n=1 Tax=Helicobacter apodemus TaxID=135569 RepID=A0A4U8UEH9_9HELI|nr:DUF5408 family protein [Helicobacter apodemus]MDE6958558.1 DUF5408 family protein [Helicobacter apodemus]TLE14511.1 hypothetical protein LS72_008400 [Helicobacter apodemus]